MTHQQRKFSSSDLRFLLFLILSTVGTMFLMMGVVPLSLGLDASSVKAPLFFATFILSYLFGWIMASIYEYLESKK